MFNEVPIVLLDHSSACPRDDCHGVDVKIVQRNEARNQTSKSQNNFGIVEQVVRKGPLV